MIGLGLALPDRALRRPRVPAAPAPLAHLPALGTPGAAWHAVVSNERLMTGYDGPLALVGNGEGVTGAVDLGAGATGLAPADLPAPVVGLYGWYDQSGGGRHFVQDALAARPHLRAEATTGGRLAAAFWGVETRTGASLAGAQTLDAGNRTEAWVIDPTYSIQNAVFAEQAAANGAPSRFTYTAPSDGGVLRVAGGRGGVIAAQPQVWVVVDGPAGGALWVNGVKRDLPAGPAAAAIARTTLGWSPASGAGSIANARIAAYASIAGAVDDADASAISAALAARFRVDAAHALNLVHIGDSIVEGVLATDTIGFKAALFPRLATTVRYVNLGISGKRLAQCHADRGAYEAALLERGVRNVALIDAGINDLCFGDQPGDALYAAVTVPYVAALAAMGYEVGVVTVLPQDSTAYGVPIAAAAVETRRRAYNAAVRANAAAASFVVDRAAGAMDVFPTACDDPALFPDRLHPSTACYALLAPSYAAALNKAPTT